MKILVLNCGSSSIKFQLIETDAGMMESNSDHCSAKGIVERIGAGESVVRLEVPPRTAESHVAEISDHQAALREIIQALENAQVLADISQIEAVGHRMVLGGERFAAAVMIDDEVVNEIQQWIEVAPLHNPHNLRGYEVVRSLMGQVPQVAVFDTAFHRTLPPKAYLYALPYDYYRRYRIRRFGFHGTSHRYVAFRFRQMLRMAREEVNLITCHLGNGCSLTAIEKGNSVDTSLGFTPLEGLVMGTRCGDVDPGVILFLMRKNKLTPQDMSAILNEESGLYGLSGRSNDMRDLITASERGDKQAQLAIDVFCYRLRKYIGAYTAVLGRVAGLIFTGGIGENSPLVRERSCERLSELGFVLDPEKNCRVIGEEGEISCQSSRARIMVIPTNEELLIARDTYRVAHGLPPLC